MTMDEQEHTTIGKSVPRVDGRDKVRGTAQYLEDIKVAGMLHGKVLRSQYAHARIVNIDTSRARQLPGVKGVVTGADLPFFHGETIVDEPFLARDTVRYTGEGIAAVAAVDEETAEEALSCIAVDYEELPAVLDVLAAAGPDSPRIHPQLAGYQHAPGIAPIAGSNICNHFRLEQGDIAKGFAASDFVFEDTFTTQMQQHCSIEPHGAICAISDDRKVTLWTNNDSPYRCRKEMAVALNVPLNDVRIISAPYIGGNFGGKGGLKAEAAALALAWKIRNKPIRVLFTREEEFCSAIGRHPSRVRIKTGVMRDGSIVAREVQIYLDTGAYAEKGPTITRFCGISAAGPYKIPNVKIDAYCVYTNKTMAGAMRGYGGPQAAWAYESQMDMIAARLRMDPLELRLRHAYEDGDTHVTGQQIESEGLKECLQKVAQSMNWGTRPAKKDTGRGIACMERAVKTPFGSAAFVKVNEDGSVDVLSSTTDVGQGSETVLCQIAAEELGVSCAVVRKAAPDTAFTPWDASTTSSRSTFHMGNAVRLAAADAREQILKLAAPLLEGEVHELALCEGKVLNRLRPEKTLSIAQVLARKYGSCGTVLGRGYFWPEMPEQSTEYYARYMVYWLIGACGAEVEVNRKTGQVKVLKLWGAYDAGKALNPLSCEGMIEGGLTIGMGFALAEEMVLKDGNVMNPSFLSYKIPSAVDVPEIVPLLVEHPHPGGPFGAKGMGETTNVPVPPAIANAIYDAVGVRIQSLPITPEKILEALKRKETTEAEMDRVPRESYEATQV